MINESKKIELIKRQKETGLNITAFCVNEGIPKSSFYYWRKKLCKEPGKGFIPLLVNSTPATLRGPSRNYTRELHEQPKSGDEFLLELLYPNGTRLRLKSDADFDNLRTLVCLLD